MHQLFKNKQSQETFERDGYVILKLLDDKEVNDLLHFYTDSLIRQSKKDVFYVGSDNNNKSLVNGMTDFILNATRDKLNSVLQDYRPITASYIIKYPTPNGTINPHQDWSFVDDETEYCSMTCWIPLLDVGIRTGCMGVIKGSHHIFNNVRPSPMPYVKTPLSAHNDLLISYLHMLPMKAGEALFFNHRAVHASLPNTTGKDRNAVGIAIANNAANMVHYYLHPGKADLLLMYQSDPDFYKRYDNFLLGDYYRSGKVLSAEKVLGEKQYIYPVYTKEALEKKLIEFDNRKHTNVKKYLLYLKGVNALQHIKSRLTGLFTQQ